MDWREKANRRIQELARGSWRAANTLHSGPRKGQLRKRHRPYTIPAEADALVEALGDHDEQRGELRAKRIFVYGYRPGVAD